METGKKTVRKTIARKSSVRKAINPSKSLSLNDILTDSRSAIEGVWINIQGPFDVLVARAGNPKYRSALQRYLAAALADHKASSLDELPDGVFDTVMTRAMAEAILVGWRGIHDDDGPIKYSVERAYELLDNQDAYEIRQAIESASVTRDNYVSASVEDAIKK